MYTRRSSPRLTSGLSSTPRTSVKMAALAPMPSASVRMTIAARPLVRLSEWNATRKSRRNDIVVPPELETEVSIARANAKHHIVRYLVSGVWSGMLVFRMPLSQIRTPALPDGRLHFPGLLAYRSCGGHVARLHYSDERRDRNSTPGAEISWFFPNSGQFAAPVRPRPAAGFARPA